MQKIIKLATCLALISLTLTGMIPKTTVASGVSTSVTVTKYNADGTVILAQETYDWEWMMNNLPVQGDGVTHYYFQGPTFDDSSFDTLWDPGETVNIDSRDYGAAKGTDVKDLCELVGGASSGDTIKIKASDGFSKQFDYEDVYLPEPEQGKMVVTWYTTDNAECQGGYVTEEYTTGMRLLFFAETLNPDGKHVFGIWDMHETLEETRWHYYYDGTLWPSSSGLSVKYVSDIEIYSSESEEETANDSLTATANVILDSVGISLNVDSIDFGDVKPGENSEVKTVTVSNSGNTDVKVTLEVQGNDDTAQDFYEQSLYVDNDIYDADTVISNISVGNSDDVDTQLKVPTTWSATGSQEATFIFWATASD